MVIGLEVKYKAYDLVEEKAQTLKNSKGTKQGRLYLTDYNGVKGGCRLAVAAESITFSNGKKPRLNWFQRRRFILLSHESGGNPTWYKVNKNSLRKRLGLNIEDLETTKKGACTSLLKGKIETKIGEFEQRFKKLMNKLCLFDCLEDGVKLELFEKQFVINLANNPIQREYWNICFYNTNANNKKDFYHYNEVDPFEMDPTDPHDPKTTLIVQYDQSSVLVRPPNYEDEPKPTPDNLTGADLELRVKGINELFAEPKSPLVRVKITEKDYKTIMSGKPFSNKLRNALEAN